MADAHTNFAYSTVVGTTSKNGSAPGSTGYYLTVQDGDSYKFPTVPFNATVWPSGSQPTSSNAEIVRVTAANDDTFTLANSGGNRTSQEGTTTQSIQINWQIAATITAKTLTDAEDPINFYAPMIYGSAQTGLQTLFSTSGGTNVSTASLFVFPFSVPPNLRVNQFLLANSFSVVSNTSNATYRNSYYSEFGLYSRNGNALSLMTSNSFSIAETYSSNSYTWSYPASTAISGTASGYVYATKGFSGTPQLSSYISGQRIVGLDFYTNTNSSLTNGVLSLTGGVYWLGVLSLRSFSTASTHGLSFAGLMGQIVNVMNQPVSSTAAGSVGYALQAIGYPATAWTSQNTNLTNWFGRHIMGFMTNTARADFGGTAIPSSINLSELYAAGSSTGNTTNATWQTILPFVTVVST
jgi:hypothetical protein